jgi:hypothetical protein
MNTASCHDSYVSKAHPKTKKFATSESTTSPPRLVTTNFLISFTVGKLPPHWSFGHRRIVSVFQVDRRPRKDVEDGERKDELGGGGISRREYRLRFCNVWDGRGNGKVAFEEVKVDSLLCGPFHRTKKAC